MPLLAPDAVEPLAFITPTELCEIELVLGTMKPVAEEVVVEVGTTTIVATEVEEAEDWPLWLLAA